MEEKEFRNLEEKYIELFHVRPWILKFFDIPINEKNQILMSSIKNKKEIDVEKIREKYKEIKNS